MWSQLIPVLWMLIQINFLSVSAVDNLEVTLEGTPGTDDYLQVNAGLHYQLRCRYRAGYDDVVNRVSWRLYGREVFVYTVDSSSITASPPLRGHVDLSSHKEFPQDIHITNVQMDMTGSYTCIVSSSSGTLESKPIDIKVIDIGNDNFETEVSILGDSDITTEASTSVEASTVFGPAEPPVPDPSCILLWSFKSPAITPRPDIVCGYYSYTHDDIHQVVGGGLKSHQMQNGSWSAEIRNTKIPVIEIPYQGRLGCSVTIPNTSYRKIVKFEDGLTVDLLIDSKGCPTLQGLNDYYDIEVEVEDASTTCRGDHAPHSKVEPAGATLSCPQAARYRDGRLVTGWKMEISCLHSEMMWREISVTDDSVIIPLMSRSNGEADGAEARDSGNFINIETYPWPLCVDLTSSATAKSVSILLMILSLLSVL